MAYVPPPPAAQHHAADEPLNDGLRAYLVDQAARGCLRHSADARLVLALDARLTAVERRLAEQVEISAEYKDSGKAETLRARAAEAEVERLQRELAEARYVAELYQRAADAVFQPMAENGYRPILDGFIGAGHCKADGIVRLARAFVEARDELARLRLELGRASRALSAVPGGADLVNAVASPDPREVALASCKGMGWATARRLLALPLPVTEAMVWPVLRSVPRVGRILFVRFAVRVLNGTPAEAEDPDRLWAEVVAASSVDDHGWTEPPAAAAEG